MATTVDERVSEEMEALEAILMGDVTVKRKDGVPYGVETVLHPSTADDADQQFVCVTMEVLLTENYPEESPKVHLRNPRGLDQDLVENIDVQIAERLKKCLGQPVIFELIELVRENLTDSNLPSGQCVICLCGFIKGDMFIKTVCYHHFHSYCLANHFIAGLKYYHEELEKLPAWQQVQAPPYQQTCPVCRCVMTCDVETLKVGKPPIESVNAPPFVLTPELKALQVEMATLLAHQTAKGGVVGSAVGPPPLTITTAEDEVEAANVTATEQASPEVPKPEPPKPAVNAQASGEKVDKTPAAKPAYRGPYRGFNRRGKPGRRGAR